MLEAFERAATHARRAGLSNEFIGWRATARLLGPAPLSEVLAWLDAQQEQWGSLHSLRSVRAQALCMLGRFDEARSILANVREEQTERGGGIQLGVGLGHTDAGVELLAGNAGRVVTRTMILDHVWRMRIDPATNVVDVHIYRLRSKVDRDTMRPLIHTIRGVGYVLKAA